jgi:predicted O-methyltransferase YrrM
MYQLNEAVFRKDKKEDVHYDIEKIRSVLLRRNDVVPSEDYGAGSKSGGQSQRKLSEIVRNSSKSPRYARLLFRLTRYLKPAMMLELGTAAGISALYQCKGNPAGKMITLEGNRVLASIAAEVLAGQKAEVIAGNFDDTLSEVIAQNRPVDYFFIDGNHRKEPVLKYFNQVFPALAEEALIVVDDINWSDEMQSAWNELKSDPRIQVSVDLFQLGLLFIRPGLSKQDFTIRY